MGCSGAFFRQSRTLPSLGCGVGREQQCKSRVCREPEIMDRSLDLVTVGGTGRKRRDDLFRLTHNQRWSEPEPMAPISQGPFALSTGLALPLLQMSYRTLTFNANILAAGFKSALWLYFLFWVFLNHWFLFICCLLCWVFL